VAQALELEFEEISEQVLEWVSEQAAEQVLEQAFELLHHSKPRVIDQVCSAIPRHNILPPRPRDGKRHADVRSVSPDHLGNQIISIISIPQQDPSFTTK
jgi:hypothetical protein